MARCVWIALIIASTACAEQPSGVSVDCSTEGADCASEVLSAIEDIAEQFALHDFVADLSPRLAEHGLNVLVETAPRCPDGTNGCTFVDDDGRLHIAVVRGTGYYAGCPNVASVFVHELAHAALYVERGDTDAQHVAPGVWGTDGIVGSVAMAPLCLTPFTDTHAVADGSRAQ